MHPQQSSRVDVGELKSQIVRKLGPDKSKQYFSYLNRLLSGDLTKSEFGKLCCRVLGRENLPLHNQLIRSILKNACQAKTPPPCREAGPPKSAIQVAKGSPSNEDGYQQGGSTVPSQHQNIPLLSNGVLPALPKRCRSGNRGKPKDRPSPLGPNGKLERISHQSTDKAIMENGDLAPCDYQRPVHDLQAVSEQPDNQVESLAQQPSKRLKLDGKDVLAPAEDGEEGERLNHLKVSTSPLLAPLGIPYCSASIGGARKTTPVDYTGDFVSYHDSGVLSDTETLRKRMEQIAVAQGFGGVSTECATMLNKMLDVYLKRLIKPCVELVGARRAQDLKHPPLHKQQVQHKIINGMRPRNHMHIQSGGGSMHTLQEQRPLCSISMLDLKVAMDLNPQLLGEDWPLHLEKIHMQSFEE